MTGRTHIMGGVTAGIIYLIASSRGDFGIAHLGAIQGIGTMAASVIGGLAPDIDLNTSKIGATAKPVSKAINKLVGHRTVCHSPLLLLLIYLVLTSKYPSAQPFVLAFTFGAISHLGLDALNKAGVPLLWPITTRFWVLGIKIESRAEKILFAALCAVAVLSLLHLSMLLLDG